MKRYGRRSVALALGRSKYSQTWVGQTGVWPTTPVKLRLARNASPADKGSNAEAQNMSLVNWGEKHILRIAGETHYPEPVVGSDLSKWMSLRRQEIEPWLSSIFQGEHLSLLLGSGFSTAISQEAGAASAGMSTVTFGCDREDQLNSYAAAPARNPGAAWATCR